MTKTCDRCRKRPAVCVVGATMLWDKADDVEPYGGYGRVPLEAAGLWTLHGRRFATETQADSYMQLCAVCSGRL